MIARTCVSVIVVLVLGVGFVHGICTPNPCSTTSYGCDTLSSGAFQCLCSVGYTGKLCDIVVDAPIVASLIINRPLDVVNGLPSGQTTFRNQLFTDLTTALPFPNNQLIYVYADVYPIGASTSTGALVAVVQLSQPADIASLTAAQYAQLLSPSAMLATLQTAAADVNSALRSNARTWTKALMASGSGAVVLGDARYPAVELPVAGSDWAGSAWGALVSSYSNRYASDPLALAYDSFTTSDLAVDELEEREVLFAVVDSPYLSPVVCPQCVALPVTGQAVAVVFNVPDLTVLNVTLDLVARIFSGAITVWSDAALVSANPSLSTVIPDATAIALVLPPASAAATNWAFTLALASSTPATVWSGLGAAAVGEWPLWPYTDPSAVQQADSWSDAVQRMLETPYAVTVMPFARVQPLLAVSSLRVASVVNRRGVSVTPSAASARAALATASSPLTVATAQNTPGLTGYPMVALTYLALRTTETRPNCDGAAGMRRMLQWVTRPSVAPGAGGATVDHTSAADVVWLRQGFAPLSNTHKQATYQALTAVGCTVGVIPPPVYTSPDVISSSSSSTGNVSPGPVSSTATSYGVVQQFIRNDTNDLEGWMLAVVIVGSVSCVICMVAFVCCACALRQDKATPVKPKSADDPARERYVGTKPRTSEQFSEDVALVDATTPRRAEEPPNWHIKYVD